MHQSIKIKVIVWTIFHTKSWTQPQYQKFIGHELPRTIAVGVNKEEAGTEREVMGGTHTHARMLLSICQKFLFRYSKEDKREMSEWNRFYDTPQKRLFIYLEIVLWHSQLRCRCLAHSCLARLMSQNESADLQEAATSALCSLLRLPADTDV